MPDVADTSGPLTAVLESWKAAVDAHQPEQVGALFTDDAIFQGLHPYSVGPAGVAAYYAEQPIGMTAAYTILETRQPARDLILGYLTVDFSFTDRPTLTVFLSMLITQRADDWKIALYQVSKLD